MNSIRLLAIVVLSGIPRITAANSAACEASDIIEFGFTDGMHFEFTGGSPVRVLQFIMTNNIKADSYYLWFYRHALRLTPGTASIFNQIFESKIKALRQDLPKYFCQPFFEDDELRLMADLFSDRIDEVLDEIRTNAELANISAPVPGLVQVALHLTLPPFCADGKAFNGYCPRELVSATNRAQHYQEGRGQWREALAKAQNEKLKYKGPVPAVVRRPMATASQVCPMDVNGIPDDIWLYVLTLTGPHIWHARLVCKKWRAASGPHSMVGMLGYGRAFKMLSGRETWGNLVLRLDSLAELALKESNGAGTVALESDAVDLSSGSAAKASPDKWAGIVSGLREIIRAVDPIRAITWYRDAQAKFPGLGKIIEADVFGLFLSARDDLLASVFLTLLLHHRFIGYHDSSWGAFNRNAGFRLLRAYLEKYPEAAKGHPLPDEDTWVAWREFGGL